MTNLKLLKRGRPPKESSSSQVLPPIRVTPEQKDIYKKAAELAGMSLSAWLKKAADEKLTHPQREENECPK